MAVTQYIGARYVPMFSDPLDWDSTKAYEPLTIVYYLGNSYTSRQSVPTGIDISNTDYWAITGNYNAQIEAYRKEVTAYDGRITANAQAIADEVTRAVAEEAAIKELITAETTRAKAAESELATGVSNALTRISEETERAEKAEAALETKIDSKTNMSKKVVLLGDSWTQRNSKALEAAFLAFDDINEVHNFGVSGARIQQLSTQVDSATADTSFDNSTITDVIVVAGTNNAYWGTAITEDEAKTAFAYIVANFGNANVHWFPNNSRTVNGGNNSMYATIAKGATAAGATVYMQILMLLISNGFDLYEGTDQSGVQHLTVTGYQTYAAYCHGLMNGADYSAYPVDFDFACATTSDSSVSATSGSGNFHGTVGGGGVVTMTFSGIDWNSGYSQSNPGTARFGTYPDSTGANTSPLNIKSNTLRDYFPACLNAGASNQVMLAGARSEDTAKAGMPCKIPLYSGLSFSRIAVCFELANPLGI